MKKHFRNFCVRGMTFAWTGPVILAVVWLCLERAGIVSMLTVNEAVLGIVSSAIMVFVAAGISIVYQIENIPKAFEPSAPCLQDIFPAGQTVCLRPRGARPGKAKRAPSQRKKSGNCSSACRTTRRVTASGCCSR